MNFCGDTIQPMTGGRQGSKEAQNIGVKRGGQVGDLLRRQSQLMPCDGLDWKPDTSVPLYSHISG